MKPNQFKRIFEHFTQTYKMTPTEVYMNEKTFVDLHEANTFGLASDPITYQDRAAYKHALISYDPSLLNNEVNVVAHYGNGLNHKAAKYFGDNFSDGPITEAKNHG